MMIKMMLRMQDFAARLRRDEEGASMVEYGLLVSLIAVVGIGAVTLLGGNISAQLNAAAAAL